MKEDILDKYALNTLEDKDKRLLEKVLAQDPDFQKELDLHADIIKGMEVHMDALLDQAFLEANAYADQALKNTIQAVDAELEKGGFFTAPILKVQQEEDSIESELVHNIKKLGEEELSTTIKTVDAELEKEGFFEQKTAISTTKEQPNPKGTPIISIMKIVAAAACVILVLTFGWDYINNSGDQNTPLELAFVHYDNGFSKQVAGVLSEEGFAGKPEEDQLKQLLSGMEAYETKDYARASDILSSVVQEGVQEGPRYQAQAELFLALSYIGNAQSNEAQALLEKLAKSDFEIKETAIWYLAKLHINDKNMGLAKLQLELLKNSSEYGQAASELMEKI